MATNSMCRSLRLLWCTTRIRGMCYGPSYPRTLWNQRGCVSLRRYHSDIEACLCGPELPLWFRWRFGGRGLARLELRHSLGQRFLERPGHNEYLSGITPAGIVSAAVLSHRVSQDQALGTTIAPRQENLPLRLVQPRL